MDLTQILEYAVYAIAIASIIAPAFTKISAMTSNTTDDKIAGYFAKGIELANEIVQFISVNKADDAVKKKVEKTEETEK